MPGIKPIPSAEFLHSRFSYDPETGLLTSLWSGLPIRKVGGTGYLTVSIKGSNFRVGRVVWKMMTGEDPQYTIDHINRDKNDNRWVNLRDVTLQVNNRNRRRSSRQKRACAISVKRVLNHGKFECWHVHITVDFKYVYLGQFTDKVEAYRCFSRAAWQRYRGESVLMGPR